MKVPTISLKQVLQAEGNSAEAALPAQLVAEQLRNACQEVGFFVLCDHGVSESLMESYREECRAFFKRPPQCHVLGMVSKSRFIWLDYVPAECGEPAWSLGPVDGRGSMPWQLDREELATSWAAYYVAMEKLVELLMRLLALSLGLSADAFDEALQGHRSSMRAILYPEVAEADFRDGDVIRSPEHTDWGCLTVLLPDPHVSGLEVCDKEGSWMPLHCPPGSLVVNLGELLQWWSGGQCLATPHRVVARPGSAAERLSCPYFGLVNRRTLIQPLVGESADAVTAGDFIQDHERFVRHMSSSSRCQALEGALEPNWRMCAMCKKAAVVLRVGSERLQDGL
ncbi:unnamed protein product [Effrenium voratum]|nr:unnamed protein product [Effrenium voratum]CAJ1458440.1 unnamed protein product [Effrenium voratum]